MKRLKAYHFLICSVREEFFVATKRSQARPLTFPTNTFDGLALSCRWTAPPLPHTFWIWMTNVMLFCNDKNEDATLIFTTIGDLSEIVLSLKDTKEEMLSLGVDHQINISDFIPLSDRRLLAGPWKSSFTWRKW